MPERLRVGVAGLGVVAQTVHLPLLARRRDLFQLAAVCDLSRATRAVVGERWGVPPDRRHGTLGAMLSAGGLDAVLVLTSGSHGPAVLEALDAGLPVLCEKPLAFSRAETEAVRDRAGGVPRVQVGYMKQYDAAFAALRDQLPGGIAAVEVEVLHPADAAQLDFARLPPRPTDPADVDPALLAALGHDDQAALDVALGTEASPDVRRFYADVLLGSLVHDIALVRDLVGPPRTLDAVRRWRTVPGPGSLDVRGTVAEGAPLSMRWHFLPDYPIYRETLTVHHEQGTLQVAFPSPYLLDRPSELLVVEGTAGRPGSERRTLLRPAGEEFEAELVGLHAMVTRGVPPLSGPVEARSDVETAQRIVRAWCAQEGRALGGEAAHER